jgi:F-type H+-transporting ATPase subunit delta
VDATVDPAVIGGLSVEIAGERIDSTVSTKLADARRGLVG